MTDPDHRPGEHPDGPGRSPDAPGGGPDPRPDQGTDRPPLSPGPWGDTRRPADDPNRPRPRIWKFAPATFGVAVVCGLLFLGTLADPTLLMRGAMVPDAVWSGEWWRLVTSIFLHAGFIHVAFNVAWWINLGAAVEVRYGAIGLLSLTLFTGLAGGLAELAVSGLDVAGSVGLSGAVYGLFFFGFVALRHLPGAFALLFSKQNAWLLAGWGVLAFILTTFDILSIGNFAHGAGALTGALAGFSVRGRKGARVAAMVAAALLSAGLASAAVRPVWLTRWQVWAAVDAFNAQRYDVARERLAVAYGRSPEDPTVRALFAVTLAITGEEGEAAVVADTLGEGDLAMLTPQVRGLFEDVFRRNGAGPARGR